MNYGICPKCRRKVQLIYIGRDLRIGPHHPKVVEGLTSEQFARNDCEGYGRKPLNEEAALE